jgi:hypothetical protein
MALFIQNSLLAYELPKKCLNKKIQAIDCVFCQDKSVTNSDFDFIKIKKINNFLSNKKNAIEVYADKAIQARKINLLRKDNYASMFRTLRDKEKEITSHTGKIEISKIKEEFDKLTSLTFESTFLQRKHFACMHSCSSQHKLEILDDIKKVQKLKSIIVLSTPILANKNFEQVFTNMTDSFADKEEMFSDSIFEKALFDSLFQNLQILLKIEDEFSLFIWNLNKTSIKDLNDDATKKYVDEVIEKYPAISTTIAHHFALEETSSLENTEAECYIVNKHKLNSDKLENQELAADIILFAAPFVLGPAVRAASSAFELLILPRLANYGLKMAETSKLINTSNLTLQAGILGTDLNRILEQIDKCKNQETEFNTAPNSEKYIKLKECNEKTGQQILFAELSLIPLGFTHISPNTLNLLKLKSNPVNLDKTYLLFKDFGGGKNKLIKKEIEDIKELVRQDRDKNIKLSNVPKDKKTEINNFLRHDKAEIQNQAIANIPASRLDLYQESVGKDTIELLYIPGAEVPHLPEAIRNVGHIALRIGDKVYHQTGGSGFKIENFKDFINLTKGKYKIYGQVLKASEKEQAVMENYFKKIKEKKLPYSFLVNNCSQTICRSLSLADFEKVNPVAALDPLFTKMTIERSERVLLKTSYNMDKDVSEFDLKKATLANRAAFYGIPLAVSTAAATGSYQAIDFVIEYLNQIKEAR